MVACRDAPGLMQLSDCIRTYQTLFREFQFLLGFGKVELVLLVVRALRLRGGGRGLGRVGLRNFGHAGGEGAGGEGVVRVYKCFGAPVVFEKVVFMAQSQVDAGEKCRAEQVVKVDKSISQMDPSGWPVHPSGSAMPAPWVNREREARSVL